MTQGIIAGSFDVIHPGYIAMFDTMMEECDEVIVLLQTDPTIERPEKCKPILSVLERMDILGSLHQVDHILTYTTERELHLHLKNFQTTHLYENNDTKVVRYLGDDYIGKPFTGDDLLLETRYLSRDHGWSTTKYKQLIADSICGTNSTNGSN
jgi:glycerol-3-phosphate cytidylyltransferase